MLNLSLNELKEIAKMRCIKGYNNMSKEMLLSVVSESESAKSLGNVEIEKIREDLDKSRHKFSKSEIKEIRKKSFRNREQKKIFNTKNKRH